MKNELPNNHGLYENVIENRHLMPRDGDNISITDIQYDALAAGVARGADLLISAPTSTGKTLIGWWAVCSALNAGARVVYLVSYRALAHQKFEEVQRLFLGSFLGDDRSSITCATGDGVENASGRKTNAPLSSRILIATYEKFLGCLSTGGPPVDLTDICFICDEVQLIGEKNRGQNVELLLTLLKKTGWRQFIGLSAVLDDPDAQALADWLNLNLVRNPDREKQITIECRVSEKNIEFISKPQESPVWRENALKKPQNLSTSYIVETLSKHSEHRPVIVFCMRVADTFDLAEEVGMNRSSSIQVDVPNGWDIDLSLLGLLGKRIAYHNAELSEEERLFVEMRLAAGQVEIVFATSTLAAGVNFPLGSAVFSSWKRWNFDRRRHELIGRAEFQNMAGRVGRMGQATSNGLVIMTASNERELGEAKYLMDFERHDQLESGIAPEDFGLLVLQIIAGKLCGNRDQVFDLLRSTLSAAREISRNADGVNYWRPYMDRQIDRLIALGCIIETPYRMTATTLGEVVARSGLKPETAIYFIDGFSKFGAQLTEMLPSGDSEGNEDDFGFILSHAALASPEYGLMGGAAARRIPWRISDSPLVDNPPARKLSSLLFSQPWMGDRGAANGALLLLLWFSGSPRKDIEGCVSGVRLGTVQTMARDVSWVLNGISEVLAAITSPALAEESKPPLLRDPKTASIVRRLVRAVKRQAARISTGLPGKALWLTNLDLQQRPRRLSRSQVLSLFSHGLTRPISLMDGSQAVDAARQKALNTPSNPRLANLVRDAARRWKIDNQEYCKKIHLKRAKILGCAAIIERIYSARGDDFEDAFSSLLDFVAVNYKKLDQKGKIGYPDFLIDVDSLPSVVVELKTKVSNTDMVAFNAAVEVLSASELIGFRDNPCLTVCSPSVEPSVPQLIERCGRLSVVEVCDLAEAALRLKEEKLTRSEFYNWITTPGIALREDLPVSC